MTYKSPSNRFPDEKDKALAGTATKHCVSGSLMRLYAWYGIEIEEEVLLGLGEGIGFIYWHQKGTSPMLGGRSQPEEGLENIAAKRTGLVFSKQTTSSVQKAERTLISALQTGHAVLLYADMGFLPYFDFAGSGYYFGGHAILACGFDPKTNMVLIADREKDFYEIPMETLSTARSSTYKPFPPHNHSWSANFQKFHGPQNIDLALSLHNQAYAMLNPPITNIGCKGIRKAAAKVKAWEKELVGHELGDALFNIWIFASEKGGSGGGNFRHMASRYAAYCADRCKSTHFQKASQLLHDAALLWDKTATIGHEVFDIQRAIQINACKEIGQILIQISDIEDKAWSLCLGQ